METNYLPDALAKKNIFPRDLISSPLKSIPGTEIVYTSGYYTLTHKGAAAYGKSIISPADGTVIVHLLDDYEADGTTERYCSMKLLADVERGMIFDKIKEDGTTLTGADLDAITLYVI
jgi:hypothetical protein